MSLWHADFRGHGVFDTNFSFPPGVIHRHQHVLASICEISQPQGEPLDFPFQGAASMWIDSIVPQDDSSVTVRIGVDHDSDLNIRIQFTVFD
jgi:hypothetical protein